MTRLHNILIVLQGVDIATTIYALETTGAREGNPLGIWWLGFMGYWGLVVAKLVGTLFSIAIISWLRGKGFKPWRAWYGAVLVLMTMVVVNNGITIIRHSG